MPDQVPTGKGKDQQGEFQERRITGFTSGAEMVVEGNCSWDEVDERPGVAQPGATLRAPPEQTQRESDYTVKCGTAEHHSLIVKLADPLVLVGSLQQKRAFLDVKDVCGYVLRLTDTLVVVRDHPRLFVAARQIICSRYIGRGHVIGRGWFWFRAEGVDQRLGNQSLVLFLAIDMG